MKKFLLENGQNRLKSNKRTVQFDYEHYMKACEIIAEDIKNNYDVSDNNLELIGIARGGLPMLVTLSHLLGIRTISMIQTQMSNSDEQHDYGEFRYMSDNLDINKKKCILFEDIIYKGKTTNGVIDILKSKGKDVLDVYALIIDEKFKNITIENDDVNIKYAYEIAADDWVYFFWETDINQLK